MNPKEEILNLKSGECWVWPESDYGKAEIWNINGIYLLFEIPIFGGEPMFDDYYYKESIDALIAIVESWT